MAFNPNALAAVREGEEMRKKLIAEGQDVSALDAALSANRVRYGKQMKKLVHVLHKYDPHVKIHKIEPAWKEGDQVPRAIYKVKKRRGTTTFNQTQENADEQYAKEVADE